MQPYVRAVMRLAVYEEDTDGSAYGSVEPITGLKLSATGATFKRCAVALQQKVEALVVDAARTGLTLPTIDGVTPPRASDEPHLFH